MTDLSRRYYAALVLPFDENGTIDEAGYRDLVQYFLQERFRSVGGLIANPDPGEIYYLTREEKHRVAEVAVRQAAGKCRCSAAFSISPPRRVRIAHPLP